jgi:mycoredoxin
MRRGTRVASGEQQTGDVHQPCAARYVRSGGDSLTGATQTVKMFTTTWCGYCKGTKRYLDSKGITYEEIDIEQHPEYGEAIEQASGGFRTVPTLEVGGKLYVNPSRTEMDGLFGV